MGSKIIESRIRYIHSENFPHAMNTSQVYSLIYFIEDDAVVIFSNDMTSRKKIELPYFILFAYDMVIVNFRIPQRLTEVHIELKGSVYLHLKFDEEDVKNSFGETLKKRIKTIQSSEEKAVAHHKYSYVELKYRFAKILES